MPLYLFYTMVQKVKDDQKLKSRGGGSCQGKFAPHKWQKHMWKKKLHEKQWQKSHFQIRFWRGETPVGSSASLSDLAPRTRQRRSHLDPKMTENSGAGAVRAGKRRAWAWELLFRLR